MRAFPRLRILLLLAALAAPAAALTQVSLLDFAAVLLLQCCHVVCAAHQLPPN
jgi:hypothetical protein